MRNTTRVGRLGLFFGSHDPSNKRFRPYYQIVVVAVILALIVFSASVEVLTTVTTQPLQSNTTMIGVPGGSNTSFTPRLNTTTTHSSTSSVYDPIAIGNASIDRYDQYFLAAAAEYGLDPMLLKAQAMVESRMNADAIGLIDDWLPCGTHSYGLLQVTPGCTTPFARLYFYMPPTGTINGVGNATDYNCNQLGGCIVEENNILINLINSSSSPFWRFSAFNPQYAIFGAARLVWVPDLVYAREIVRNCSEVEYNMIALGAYRSGWGAGFRSCTSYNWLAQPYVEDVLSWYKQFAQMAGWRNPGYY